MRQKEICKFRKIKIEFDEVTLENPEELGNSDGLPANTDFKNCSQYNKNDCEKFGCYLDPTAGLGGIMPFDE